MDIVNSYRNNLLLLIKEIDKNSEKLNKDINISIKENDTASLNIINEKNDIINSLHEQILSLKEECEAITLKYDTLLEESKNYQKVSMVKKLS